LAVNMALKNARKLKNKSAKEMATALGYKSKVSYYNIENGIVDVTLSTAEKISTILDGPIEELFPNFFKQKVQGTKTKGRKPQAS